MKKFLVFLKIFFLLFVAGIFMIFGYGKYLENSDFSYVPALISPVEKEELRLSSEFALMYIDANANRNFKTLEFSEKISGYQKGKYYGETLKLDIQEVVRILDEKVLGKYGSKKFLIKTVLLHKAFQLEQYIPEKYKQEMQGIADASGVKYSDVLLINTYDDLLYLAGCSSISGNISEKNSEFFHARNLDYPIPELAGKTVIVKTGEVVLIGFPAYIGALTATNAKTGLSLSSHTSFSKTVQEGIPTGLLYREIIENAQSLDDAEKFLKNAKRTIGNNLLVSSLHENNSKVFEFDAQTLEARNPENFAIATNHFVSKKFPQNMSVNSGKRYSTLEIFTENMGVKTLHATSLPNLQKILSTYDKNPKGWSSLSNFGTVQSVIIFPKSHQIFIANGTVAPVTSAGYVTYEY